jgi:ligand-binding sensor domain-containing protein
MTVCACRLLTSTSAAFSAATLSTAALHSGTLLATTRLFATSLICALRGCLDGVVVQAICQDREGTLWFGTNNGLLATKTG